MKKIILLFILCALSSSFSCSKTNTGSNVDDDSFNKYSSMLNDNEEGRDLLSFFEIKFGKRGMGAAEFEYLVNNDAIKIVSTYNGNVLFFKNSLSQKQLFNKFIENINFEKLDEYYLDSSAKDGVQFEFYIKKGDKIKIIRVSNCYYSNFEIFFEYLNRNVQPKYKIRYKQNDYANCSQSK